MMTRRLGASCRSCSPAKATRPVRVMWILSGPGPEGRAASPTRGCVLGAGLGEEKLGAADLAVTADEILEGLGRGPGRLQAGRVAGQEGPPDGRGVAAQGGGLPAQQLAPLAGEAQHVGGGRVAAPQLA